jgi:hypothetical protein
LGKPVLLDDLYPHICRWRVSARVTPGLQVTLWPKHCAACQEERQPYNPTEVDDTGTRPEKPTGAADPNPD